jgi:hypothetical protein
MRRTIGLILLAALLVAVVATAWLWHRLPWWTAPGTEAEALPPEMLADYLPSDAAGVFHLNVRRLRGAPAARPLLPSLRQLALRTRIELGWLGCARIDLAGLDDFRAILPAKEPGKALWVFRGPIDTREFQLGPKGFQERQVRGRLLWEYQDPDTGPWQLIATPHLLVAAPASRMAELFALRTPPATAPLPSTPVAPLLAHVDRSRALWLAMSLEAMGRIARPENRSLDLIVGPILRHARTVTGGLSAGDELRGEFVFTTADEEAARLLADGLRSVLLLAEAAGVLMDRDFQPLLVLFSGGEIHRDGTTVTLRCSVARSEEK